MILRNVLEFSYIIVPSFCSLIDAVLIEYMTDWVDLKLISAYLTQTFMHSGVSRTAFVQNLTNGAE